MNITFESLEAAGYKEWKSPMLKGDSKRGFQKCIYNSLDKKKYFIQVYYWEDLVAFSSDVTFYLDSENIDERFEVNYNLSKNSTIEEMEEFYSEIYTQMGCVINPINN